jgi:hypothetical protein
MSMLNIKPELYQMLPDRTLIRGLRRRHRPVCHVEPCPFQRLHSVLLAGLLHAEPLKIMSPRRRGIFGMELDRLVKNSIKVGHDFDEGVFVDLGHNRLLDLMHNGCATSNPATL